MLIECIGILCAASKPGSDDVKGSGCCLPHESAQGESGCALPSGNHSLDRHRPGQITRKRYAGMDEQIGVTHSGVVVRRVCTVCPRMVRIDAKPAQQRADFPYVRADDKIRAHGTTGFRWQDARNTAIFQALSVAFDRTPQTAQSATGADCGWKIAFRDDSRVLRRQFGCDGGEREFQVSKAGREVCRTKTLQRLSVQKLGPEGLARQGGNFTPFHPGGKHRADQTASAGSGNDSGLNPGFG